MRTIVETCLIDRCRLHLDSYTYHRHSIVARLLASGPIDVLNIGTGGGVETLEMLRRGNCVITIEISAETAERTRRRVVRNGYGDRHVGLTGHVTRLELDRKFHQIVMCEVLEHIKDDRAAIRRLSDWLLPGGRLIVSTPTATYGLIGSDALCRDETGGHVRVGYQGPELDEMLLNAGIRTVARIYNGNGLLQWQVRFERELRRLRLAPIAFAAAAFVRPILPIVDAVPWHYGDQITVAVKT